MTNILKYNRPINMHPINVMIFEKMIYISAESFTGNEFFTVFQFGFLQNKKIIWQESTNRSKSRLQRHLPKIKLYVIVAYLLKIYETLLVYGK